jgi:cation diffusion facilitator CzcD-associated flavoprotein CzcO
VRELRFAVIGSGMAGILSAVKLREAGHEFTVYEKADRVGGTWRESPVDEAGHVDRVGRSGEPLYATSVTPAHGSRPSSSSSGKIHGLAASRTASSTAKPTWR